MNGYQRDRIQDLPSEATEYMACCVKDVEELPQDLLLAVDDGDLQKIQEYIDTDADINAEFSGESLLSRACGVGQVEVVKLLLQNPDLHLNKEFGDRTPIGRAAIGGYLDCVKTILDAKLKCRPLLKKAWKAVNSLLKENDECCPVTLLHILSWASYECQWDIVKKIMQIGYYFPAKTMYQLVLQAFDNCRWDIVTAALTRKFSGKPDLLAELLSIHVTLRRWKRVEEIMQWMDEKLTMELSLVEPALNGEEEEVRKILEDKKKLKSIDLNGCLLVIAAGGTTEAVAQMLLNLKKTFTRKTYSDALFLAAMKPNSELITLLLCHAEAEYTYHDMVRAHKMLEILSVDDTPNQSLVNFLDHVMEVKAKSLVC